MKTLTRTFIAATLLAGIAGTGIASEDQDQARTLREAGDILPLEQILEKAKQKQPGRVVETELEKKSGRHVYEVKIVDDRGAVHELKYDARTGELLKAKRER